MANVSNVQVRGPLEPYADGFRASLAEQGYRPSSTERQLRLMAQFSSWLDDQSLSKDGLTIDDVARFDKLTRRAATGGRGRVSGAMKRKCSGSAGLRRHPGVAIEEVDEGLYGRYVVLAGGGEVAA
jgi:hypothetical protein